MTQATSKTDGQPGLVLDPKRLHLISFKLCPFVQRAVVVLKQKQIDFKITYIDITNPPDWFKELSPLGQVPILCVENEVLFESWVIQEYVDEVTPPSLQPKNPLVKAKSRAWISFGQDILFAMHALITTKEQSVFDDKQAMIESKLKRLESVHSGQAFFNGAQFEMIDAAYAPMFMRLDFIKQLSGLDLLAETPVMAQWSAELLKRPCVQESVVPNLPELYQLMIEKNQGLFASRIAK